METPDQESKLSLLIAERHEIVEKMKIALSRNKMRKFDHLNAKYQKLSDKIKVLKNGKGN